MSRGRDHRKKLPVGVENFETMIRKDFYYVDKTDLITEFLDNWGVVNLFTRPRRFGKSLNMSMLQSFFSMEGDKSIFEGLRISGESDLCAEYMGQYPVVALSLKSINASSYDDAIRMAANVIYKTAAPFEYLRSSDRLIREDRERYAQMLQSDMDEATLQASLRTLTRLLEKHHGRKVVVLIDEYDVPLSKAYENGYYDRMVQMLRNLFEQVLKTNPSMEFAVLTGCMRISKESIFTGLNNLKVLSMSDERYAEYFGFTDEEVRDMLAYYGRMDRYETVKEWYDGYQFGNVSIYCPWDVLNYCDRLRANPAAAPDNYWIHSSGNAEVQRFLHDADTDTTRQEIEQLIAGGTVEKQLRQELTYREMYASPDNMWSVLFTTGYLTQRGCIESKDGRMRYLLAIPNREIRSIFIDEIMEMFTARAASDTVTMERFSSALLNADPGESMGETQMNGQGMSIAQWQELPEEARPKARFWVPGAAMEEDDLRAELRGLKERGFGGVEVVGLLNTPKEVIDSEDGWGTERWLHLLDVIDETCAELGLSMDVANGPEWPISMPTVESADDPAALTELTWGVLDIGPEGYYEGPVPAGRVRHEEGTVRLLHVFAYRKNPDGALSAASYADLRNVVRVAGQGMTGKESDLRHPGADREAGSGFLREESCAPGYPALHGQEDAQVCVSLPGAPEGSTWLLFAFYMQPSTQKTGEGRYYVVDHLSRAGAGACRAYWESVLQEHHWASLESFFCDSLEYSVALDWSPEFEQEFARRRGYSILPYLPFIGYNDTYPLSDAPGYRLDHAEISDMAQQDYCECLTQCYCENHLAVLEEMAEDLGATIRYQVAYNKPFDEERCALYVAIPENEALGRPALDGLKRMGAAAQLERRRRYSFECAAEFGPGYGQNFEDLMWWVKRSLMAGMNAQVLHGASYSGSYHGSWSENGFMKGAKWPGYEAFGRVISNNWNRTLSAADCRGCLDAITRMNALFRHPVRVDCLVYRSSYRNDGLDSEFAFFPDGGRLTNAGYSYETISAPMLSHPNCVVRDGVLDPEGAAWRCLLIPPAETASIQLLLQVKRLLDAGFPVIWFGGKPVRAQYLSEWRDDVTRKEWQSALESVWIHPGLTHGDCVEDAVRILSEAGIRPRLSVQETHLSPMTAGAAADPMDLACAVHEDAAAGLLYYAVYGYNRVVYNPNGADAQDESLVSAIFRKGTTKSTYERPGEPSRHCVKISMEGAGTVYRLDEWTGTVTEAEGFALTADGRMEGWISIEEDEIVLLAVDRKRVPTEGSAGAAPMLQDEPSDCAAEGSGLSAASARIIPVHFDSLSLQEFGPDTPGEQSFLRSGFHGPERTIALHGPQDLRPWRELAPDLPRFAGKGVYRGGFTLAHRAEGRRYLLKLGDVCDTFRVWVNGTETPFPDQVMKRVDITDLVREGENVLEVRVVSNLYNRLPVTDVAPEFPFPVHFVPKDYGIRETDGKPCVLLEL